MPNILIVIIEPLATAQHYFHNITELLEGMHQYQQQRIINFYENYEYHYNQYNDGLLLYQKQTCKYR